MKREDAVKLLADIPKAELNIVFSAAICVTLCCFSANKTAFGIFSLSVINYFVKDKPHQDSLVQRYLNTVKKETSTNRNFYNQPEIQEIIKGLRHPFFRKNTKNWNIIKHAVALSMTAR